MTSTSDIKVWKDILSELKSSSEQNEVVISEIKEEIALQEQRNKKEVQERYEQLQEQAQALENLLQTLQKGTLFSLPADQETLSSFEHTITERLEFSKQLMEEAHNLLESQTTPSETIERLRTGSRRERNRNLLKNQPKEQLSKADREAREAQSLTAIANISTTGFPSPMSDTESGERSEESKESVEKVNTRSKEFKEARRNSRDNRKETRALPMRASEGRSNTKENRKNQENNFVVRAKFPRQALLGNWIHYFTKDMFTCQCFWDDSEFKEYDFKNNELVEERSGTFHVKDGKVYMDYTEGRQSVYTVTNYSDDCLEYLINRTAIRFDYMPEDQLNSLLEKASHYS